MGEDSLTDSLEVDHIKHHLHERHSAHEQQNWQAQLITAVDFKYKEAVSSSDGNKLKCCALEQFLGACSSSTLHLK